MHGLIAQVSGIAVFVGGAMELIGIGPVVRCEAVARGEVGE